MSPSSQIICAQCHCSFVRGKDKHRKFCSKSCAGKYNSAHKKTGTRISKLERFLQDHLTSWYPELAFHFNRRDAINAELDIYIPSLKLAFELNGPFHYEPIYGPEKLASMKTNDNRKMQACLERGIELCVIDISGITYFKEGNARPYLEIVLDILRLRGLQPHTENTVVSLQQPLGTLCIICGTPTKRQYNKCCSIKCRGTLHRKHPQMITCLMCKKLVNRGRNEKQKFCSMHCAGVYNRNGGGERI